MKYNVFLSYSRKDYVDEHMNVIPGNFVSDIMNALTSADITYWFDKIYIEHGDDFAQLIAKNIEASQIFVFISTYNSNLSEWTKREIATAIMMKKHIIPIRIDNTPYQVEAMLYLANLDYIDYKINPNKGINELITSIKKYLSQLELEEELLQKQQKRLINKIKRSNATINNKESKLEIERNNLLLQVEKVIDSEQREALVQIINAGGTIHLKYQKEQTALNEKLQYNENLVKILKQQIKKTSDESEKSRNNYEEKETKLEQALSQIKELDEKLSTSKAREDEYQNKIEKSSKKIKELQTQLIETQSSRDKGKSKLVHIVYCIIILVIIVPSTILMFNFNEKKQEWINLLRTTKEELFNTKKELNDLNEFTNGLSNIAPLVITEINIKNDGDNWGDSIIANKSTFFMPQIKYYGLKEGKFKLDLKIFNNHGQLSQNSEISPKGYTNSNDINIQKAFVFDSKVLKGWGGKKAGHWTAGTYRIEIWYNRKMLAEKTFQVY